MKPAAAARRRVFVEQRTAIGADAVNGAGLYSVEKKRICKYFWSKITLSNKNSGHRMLNGCHAMDADVNKSHQSSIRNNHHNVKAANVSSL